MEELPGETPVLLGGDFNFTRASHYYPGMTSPTIPPDPPDRAVTRSKDRQTPRGWTETGKRDTQARQIDYIWTRPGALERWQAQAPARLIFTNPVKLPSGESIPISDHRILTVSLCLVEKTAEQAWHQCR